MKKHYSHLFTLLGMAFTAGCQLRNEQKVKENSAVEAKAEAINSSVLFASKIQTMQDFLDVSIESGGGSAGGRVAKFFIDMRQKPEQIFFINGNFKMGGVTPEFVKFHFDFAKKHLAIPEDNEEFNNKTYFALNKSYVAGTLRSYQTKESTIPTLGIQFFPSDVVRESQLFEMLNIVKKTALLTDMNLAFVSTGPQQTTATILSQLTSLGIANKTLEQVVGNIPYLPLNTGTAFGHLRIFPDKNTRLKATDIPVFDDLPLDLSVVAGTITRAFQDANSHVNLKSKERNTPNMVLREASPNHPKLAQFADKPVKLVVGAEGFTVEPATEKQVAAQLLEKGNLPWTKVDWDPETRLLNYDQMCPSNPSECLVLNRKYGGKAANLGFLTHKAVLGRTADAGSLSQKLGYDLVPAGFGVPLQFYKDFVDFPPNKNLKDRLTKLIQDEKNGALTSETRAQAVAEVQQLFLNAKFPPEQKTLVQEKVSSVFGKTIKIKVRSSASAEDLPNFDGAGLHDSFSAKLDKVDNPDGNCIIEEETEEIGAETKRKVKSKTVACAIKGVYASMWNQRAIEERSFARLDHEFVAMAVSILPAYDNESQISGNSVLLTRFSVGKIFQDFPFLCKKETTW